MSLKEEALQPAAPSRPLARIENQLLRLLTLDLETVLYLTIFAVAVISRFWDLGARVMSHDESLHVRYSWNLYRGEGFAHTPLMHGPLLFHMTALNYLLFGDNDFTGRIYAAVVGIIVVMLPLLLRKWLGKVGALAASVMLLISPMILFHSRYIREDMPAILGAMIMVIAIWHYIESRQFRWLMWLTLGFAILYASKEVSFIYVAIFGSFLTMYFISRLLDVHWDSPLLRSLFAWTVVAGMILVFLLVSFQLLNALGVFEPILGPAPTPPPIVEESEDAPATEAVEAPRTPAERVTQVGIGLVALAAASIAAVVMLGQWRNLRRFPELDVMIVLGSLILPMLSPLVIHALGWDPTDETTVGIQRSASIAVPMFVLSALVGMLWGMNPPQKRLVTMPRSVLADTDDIAEPVPPDVDMVPVEVDPDATDWVQAFFTSRWVPIGFLFWGFFLFFFTSMFTNGSGLATGVVGSLGYWLAQQEVKRGNQPWYYYILLTVPVYEFLPAVLSLVAGVIGLRALRRRTSRRDEVDEAAAETDSTGETDSQIAPPPRKPVLDLDAPIHFPVWLFTGYWIIMNYAAYSIAGEKMPWLTTHLTIPMILLGAWVVARMIDRLEWRRFTQDYAWVLLLLLPIFATSFLRVAGPVCGFGVQRQEALHAQLSPLRGEVQALTAELDALPGEAGPFSDARRELLLQRALREAQIQFLVLRGAAWLPCNTIIPQRFHATPFAGPTIDALSTTSAWLAAVMVLVAAVAAMLYVGRGIPFEQVRRLAGAGIVLWLALLTVRTAYVAAYINYDYATEYMVYAHSSGAVKDVLERIEDLSLKTTDGMGIRVAYDNKVSWPYSWYLRDFYNAVYYGDQPSRGLIGDAPVVLAGPDNWSKVEPLLGDRYYQFEYIRMWWPMQDYFDLRGEDFENFFTDPGLQRGVWDIFYRREYTSYAEAVTDYRASQPSYALSDWPVAERMRFYVRKDLVAQVWEYGVAASEIAAATDPYAEGMRQAFPDLTFGSGVLNQPHGIDLGPDGLLYVADSGNHRIAVFDREGNFVGAFGQFGEAPAPDVLNEPWDVAVGQDDTVWVADTWNHRIVKYTTDGEYVNNWGFEGPGVNDPLAFWGPRGIEVDDQGLIYVSDTGNKRIQVFDSEGFFVQQIGTGGALEGEVDEPSGLEIGPDGLLYVADTWNQRVNVFSPTNGGFVRMWYVDAWFSQTNERPYIDVDSNGNVYITDPEAFRVIVFDSTGQYLYSFGDYTTIGLAGSVVVDDEGNVFVVDTANGTIQRYNTNTMVVPPQP